MSPWTTVSALAVEAPAAPVTSAPSAADSAAAPPPPAHAAEPAAADQLFDWTHSWYPVAALSSLNPDAPNALQLLGQRLVVWKDKQAAWRAFEDACPHR
jgi:phenylpropionate dioxygenase-like ring-hydroxylating dioxygenase large terminal subunit